MPKLVARDIMTRDILTAQADWTLATVAEFFVEHGISGAPVLSEEDELIGVISTSDLARYAADNSRSDEREEDFYFRGRVDARLSNDDMRQLRIKETSNVTVKELMTSVVFTVEEDTSISDIAGTMIQGRIHRVVVTNGSKIAGIITSIDLLKQLVDDPE